MISHHLLVGLSVSLMVACGTANDSGSGSFGGEPRPTGGMEGALMSCFYSEADPNMPAATIQYMIEVFGLVGTLHTRLTFDPGFVDNSYGTTAVGWSDSKKGEHKFSDLHRSDHAQLIFSDSAETVVMDIKMDYLSEDSGTASGYRNLGVGGGEGNVLLGDATTVLDSMTSLDRNLNERGLDSYTVNSPPADPSGTHSLEAPAWDYHVVYEVWLDQAAFGSAGFGRVRLDYVHASPSKGPDSTLLVVERPCPPEWEGECIYDCSGGGSDTPPEDPLDEPPA